MRQTYLVSLHAIVAPCPKDLSRFRFPHFLSPLKRKCRILMHSMIHVVDTPKSIMPRCSRDTACYTRDTFSHKNKVLDMTCYRYVAFFEISGYHKFITQTAYIIKYQSLSFLLDHCYVFLAVLVGERTGFCDLPNSNCFNNRRSFLHFQ